MSMLPDVPEASLIRSGEYLKALDSNVPLVSGIGCLLLFVQINWTGPPVEFSLESSFDASDLVVEGEAPYVMTRHIELVLRAGKLLEYTGHNFIQDWWYMRMLFIRQRLLENAVPRFKSEIARVIAVYDAQLMWTHLIEASLMFTYYEMEAEASEYLRRAAKMLGFTYGLTGVMGKRMKHQQFEVAQLVISTNENSTVTGALPSLDIKLEHEDILDRPEFETKVTKPSHVAVLLAHSGILAKFSARDEAQRVRVRAFIGACLECTWWSLHTTALYLRSIAECTQPTYIERAALQLQALADQVTSASVTTPVQERMLYFFQTSMLPVWEVDKMQGTLFASLGIFRTALRIFERIQMWDDVIACLLQLGEEKAAEKLINEMLQTCNLTQQKGKLLCILGDLKNDASHYHSAWSECGSVRAKRSLGRVAFKAQQWNEAIVHLTDALAINPLFPNSWFLLGCAQMQLSSWNDAAASFNRAISLDSNNGEAWNNMAICHRHAGRHMECLRALQEAARLSWDDWKVWDNLATEAVIAKDQQTAIQACKRIIEIEDCSIGAESLLDLAHRIILISDETVSARVEELLVLMQAKFSSNFRFYLLQADWYSITQDTRLQKQALWSAYRNLKAQPFYRDTWTFEELVRVMERLGSVGEMDNETVDAVVERVKEVMGSTDAYRRLLLLVHGSR